MNYDRPDSPTLDSVIQPNEPDGAPSEHSESEEEECLAEASNLHLTVQEQIKLLLLLATKKRHKLTYRAAECVMQLASVFSDTESFTPSKHLMKQAIKLYSTLITEHHICPNCNRYHGPAQEEFNCLHCGQNTSVTVNKQAGYCFLYLSIGQQLKFILESGLLDKLITPQNRQKINRWNYEDIYDGKIYRDKVLNQEVISFNFFVDGVQVRFFLLFAFICCKTCVKQLFWFFFLSGSLYK